MRKYIIILLLLFLNSCTFLGDLYVGDQKTGRLTIANHLNYNVVIKDLNKSYNDSLVVLPNHKVLVAEFNYKINEDQKYPNELDQFDAMDIIINNDKKILFKDIAKDYLSFWENGEINLNIDESFLLSLEYQKGEVSPQIFSDLVSRNGNYSLQMLSPQTDYPYGKIHYRLIDSTKKVLWQKKISSTYTGSFSYPEDNLYISDSGLSIIHQPKRILIIDKIGNILNIIKEKHASYNSYLNGYDDNYIPVTSDEKYFFYFIRYFESKKIFLVCYSLDHFNEVWRTEIKGINFPHYLRTAGNKVITYYYHSNHNYFGSTLKLLVWDVFGKAIIDYQRNVGRDLNQIFQFDEKENVIKIIYSDRVETFKVK